MNPKVSQEAGSTIYYALLRTWNYWKKSADAAKEQYGINSFSYRGAINHLYELNYASKEIYGKEIFTDKIKEFEKVMAK